MDFMQMLQSLQGNPGSAGSGAPSGMDPRQAMSMVMMALQKAGYRGGSAPAGNAPARGGSVNFPTTTQAGATEARMGAPAGNPPMPGNRNYGSQEPYMDIDPRDMGPSVRYKGGSGYVSVPRPGAAQGASFLNSTSDAPDAARFRDDPRTGEPRYAGDREEMIRAAIYNMLRNGPGAR